MDKFEQEMREWARAAGSGASDRDDQNDDDDFLDNDDDPNDDVGTETSAAEIADTGTTETGTTETGATETGTTDAEPFDADTTEAEIVDTDDVGTDHFDSRRVDVRDDAFVPDDSFGLAPDADRPRVRRSGVVLAVLVGLVGVGLCVYGGLAYRDAGEADDEAAEIAAERQDIERQEAQIRERTLAIQTAANDVNTAVRQVIASSNDFTAAGRLVTDTANAAVSILNQGNPAGARATFAETVGPAVAEHEAKFPPVAGAPGALQAALDALQAAING